MRMIATALLLGPLAALQAQADSLTLRATGEDLATGGFQAPETTRDGWTLTFSRVIATFDDITAWQTDPPFMADSATITGAALPFAGPFTVDLAAAGEDHTVTLATLPAPAGHWNALSWALVPAASGAFAGYSLVLEGTATRDGQAFGFAIGTRDAVRYACGEFLGDERLGFVTASAGSELEITLHLDHLFGRGDKPADDPMNLSAPGFDGFATGTGLQEFTLAGIHLGHVGEGHCHDTPG